MSERYIKLNGDPLHEPLHRAFHRSSGIQLTGLLFAFNAAASMMANVLTPAQGLSFMATAAASYAYAELLFRSQDSRIFARSFGSSTNRCIDTKPDHNTLPTSPNDYASAKSYLKFHTAIIGGITGIGFLHSTLKGESYASNFLTNLQDTMTKPALSSPFAILGVVFLSRSMQSSYRYYKILKNDYAIVKTPPPEPKEERAAGLVFNPS